MTTATAVRPAPPLLDLDDRLALASLAMDGRLDQAAVAFEVNTAHLPGADPIPHPVETAPPPLMPSPYRTPIADLLHRARLRIETDGWSREALVEEDGRRCAIGAIRREAAHRDQADDACVLLLEAIQRHWQAETIPSWNAAQTSHAPVLLAFGKAAELAHARNL
ncbi:MULTISPECIES: DUF6197 family protein [Streptomyces]|uniref:Uncharacterized protein n=2 Tax=Streptomyces TaxID=1883 RepID=A0A2U9NZ05_STRAS|nr:hypothetical protein [Streptomyces actuosus]AWT42576.1 hypothetical protein DMT42_09785 [Streptomyces actuosus]MBM4819783.1 hypothetical protein [Streptomyces actuosus]